MNQEDITAIEIVKNLQENLRRTQSNIRNTTLAMAMTLLIALLGSVFWGGGLNNQVYNNKEDIKELTLLVNTFVVKQTETNTSYSKRWETEKLIMISNETIRNLDMLSFWAKTRGFEGFNRGLNKESN